MKTDITDSYVVFSKILYQIHETRFSHDSKERKRQGFRPEGTGHQHGVVPPGRQNT